MANGKLVWEERTDMGSLRGFGTPDNPEHGTKKKLSYRLKWNDNHKTPRQNLLLANCIVTLTTITNPDNY